jgi:hypothetical protein
LGAKGFLGGVNVAGSSAAVHTVHKAMYIARKFLRNLDSCEPFFSHDYTEASWPFLYALWPLTNRLRPMRNLRNGSTRLEVITSIVAYTTPEPDTGGANM